MKDCVSRISSSHLQARQCRRRGVVPLLPSSAELSLRDRAPSKFLSRNGDEGLPLLRSSEKAGAFSALRSIRRESAERLYVTTTFLMGKPPPITSLELVRNLEWGAAFCGLNLSSERPRYPFDLRTAPVHLFPHSGPILGVPCCPEHPNSCPQAIDAQSLVRVEQTRKAHEWSRSIRQLTPGFWPSKKREYGPRNRDRRARQ